MLNKIFSHKFRLNKYLEVARACARATVLVYNKSETLFCLSFREKKELKIFFSQSHF